MAPTRSSSGLDFTPTVHNNIPANLSSQTLSTPFVAVITGAGKGLGRAMALAYARAGASGISISSRTASDLDSVESEMRALAKEHGKPLEILKSVVDVQLDADVQKLEEEVKHRWGRVDAVIANAGIISAYVTPNQQTLPAPTAPSNSLTSSTPESGPDSEHEASNLPIGLPADNDWSRVLNINLLGVWRISKIFLPLLASSDNGAKTLICSTSLAAHSVDSAFTPIAYNVSKIACCRLMEHVANDHGVEGIQAFALHPGAVVTPQTQNHAGPIWSHVLSDDEGLAGAFCVWLSSKSRQWLSGRYLSCNWDVDELEGMKEEIVKGELLKFRMNV